MKKFVSMFLAVCAVSSMSVTAFARQAEAINVTSDEAIKLSFGEEKFEELLLPGQTYTYPLYIEQEDGSVVPLTDEHLEDVRLRAESKNGQNSILLFGGSNRSMTKEFVDSVLAAFEGGDIILLQNEINELDYIIDKAYEKGMMIILNPSPYDSALDACDLSKVSLFLVNEIEGYQITGEKEPEKILARIKELYPKSKIVLTLGGEGSVYQDESGIYRQGIYKVKAVDTTAAGDTFTGYFISSIIDGMPVQEGLSLAAKASAIAVSRPGATASIPLREEVLAWETDNN